MSAEAIKLSEFALLIQQVIESGFAGKYYWVIGEISNFSPRKGIQYFHLVEKDQGTGKLLAELSAVSFEEGVLEIEAFERATGQKFSNGIRVLSRVSVNFHQQYGLKLYLHQLDVNFTIGELRRERDANLAKLVAENPDAVKLIDGQYHTRNQILKLPRVINRIAIVSSETSAGLEDFIHTLTKNEFGYSFSIELFHSRVQGDEAAKTTVQKLIEIFNRKEDFDIVVIVRGGGSQTDFLLYDSYPISRAIARFPIPVFCGLGHLKDISIADMMAHTSEKTPTKIAERIIAHNRNFEEALLTYQQQVIIQSQQRLSLENATLKTQHAEIQNSALQALAFHREKLDELRQKTSSKSYSLLYQHRVDLVESIGKVRNQSKVLLESDRQSILQLKLDILAKSDRLIKDHSSYLKHYQSLFNMLSPARTLARGFAIIKQNQKIVSDSSRIQVGDEVQIYLADSELTASIQTKNKRNEREFDL